MRQSEFVKESHIFMTIQIFHIYEWENVFRCHNVSSLTKDFLLTQRPLTTMCFFFLSLEPHEAFSDGHNCQQKNVKNITPKIAVMVWKRPHASHEYFCHNWIPCSLTGNVEILSVSFYCDGKYVHYKTDFMLYFFIWIFIV